MKLIDTLHPSKPESVLWMQESSEREFAPEPWDQKEGSYRWKLLHREARPALERDIIDTSERARANIDM